MEHLTATHLFGAAAEDLLHDATLSWADGVITNVAAPPQTGTASAALTASPRRLVLPALVNAHDHARPAMSSFGAAGKPLESWIAMGALGTPTDPYLAAAVALARTAKAGCGAAMIHYTRPSGRMPMVEEARAIARAGTDVGVRLAFAPAVRDQNPLVYGDERGVLAALPADARETIESLFLRPAPPPRAYLEMVDEIADAIAGPMLSVQYGPAGVQWCSRPLLEAVAEASARTGRRVHMHLLETVYQRAFADRAFPAGVVRYLKEIGLLSPRLTLAHCTHARPDELDLIAEAGATIVSNFSSNLHLRSGLTPLAEAHRRGCAFAVGVDGLALDEDDDAIREMRLVALAHGGLGFQRTWTYGGFLAGVIAAGRRTLEAPGDGALKPGAAADVLVLDYERIDRDAICPVDPLALFFARANQSFVTDVVVAGRRIVANGMPTGIDLPAAEAELRRHYRAALPAGEGLRRALPALDEGLATWFRAACPCG